MAALSITKLFLIPLEQTKRVQDSWQEWHMPYFLVASKMDHHLASPASVFHPGALTSLPEDQLTRRCIEK